MFRFASSLALFALATQVFAQTSTDCNPTKQSCPDDPALGTTLDTVFDSSMSEFNPDLFEIVAGESLIEFTDNGAELSINQQGDSVTLKTKFYVFFGRIEVLFQAAEGQGIISTINMLSDDLDEIDVEIMGGNTTATSTNYYGWGNTDQFNTLYIPSTGGNWGTQGAMGAVHNYTLNWTPEQLEWIFDGESVRTVPAGPAGKWPQTPSQLHFGIWAGGDPDNAPGTITWAGGKTDYSQGPFTMTVQSIKMIDGHQDASSYSYGDRSGTWQSIDVAKGESDAKQAVNHKTTSQQIQKSWDGLSTGAKIGIASGVAGAFALAFIAFIFYCLKERRAGAREKALADHAWDAQQAELFEYQKRMRRGDFARGHMGHGEKF